MESPDRQLVRRSTAPEVQIIWGCESSNDSATPPIEAPVYTRARVERPQTSYTGSSNSSTYRHILCKMFFLRFSLKQILRYSTVEEYHTDYNQEILSPPFWDRGLEEAVAWAPSHRISCHSTSSDIGLHTHIMVRVCIQDIASRVQ